MERKAVSAIMVTLLLVSMLTLVFNIRAAKTVTVEGKVGVNVGDWVEYKEISFSWESNVSYDELNDRIKSFIRAYEDVFYWKISILEISGTLIKFQFLWHFKNGTESIYQTFVDVATGMYTNMFFIASNLSAGEVVYTDYPDWIITETTRDTYLGVIREINILSLLDQDGRYTFEYLMAKWDRLTGILLEFYMQSDEYKENNQTFKYEARIKITGTNRWSSRTLTATINTVPNTLNLRSKGKWITAYIELPEGYDVKDINVSSILLNETVPAEPKPIAVGDYDNDSIPDLMVKFDRAKVISYILSNVNMTELIEKRFMTVTLAITGKLNDGTPFQGSNTIKIKGHDAKIHAKIKEIHTTVLKTLPKHSFFSTIYLWLRKKSLNG